MDGFETNEGVILIAATNRPDVLDPALLRPGRFDRQVVVPRPDVKGREEILRVHARRIPLAPNVELKVLARGTPGFSGADLANLVNEAALLAARQNKKLVEMPDFENAKDKVLMGVERRSMIISDTEKRTIAYHEAGHALVADFLPGTDPAAQGDDHPARARAGPHHAAAAWTTSTTTRSDYLINRITILLGGRTAEEIVLNQQTTGAGDDLEKATEMARKMVCEWGMSDKLGPLTFGKNEEHIFLGREVARQKDYSEDTALAIDGEIKRIVIECATRARQILEENIEKLHALARALLERESLDGEEIARILRRARAACSTEARPLRPIATTWVRRPPVSGDGTLRRAFWHGARTDVGMSARRGLPVAVMGVLNVSPESFHAGSVHRERRRSVLRAALAMVEAGASLVDVGARSTAPYLATAIDERTEEDRLVAGRRGCWPPRWPCPSPPTPPAPGRPVPPSMPARAIINDLRGAADPALARLVARTASGSSCMARPRQATPEDGGSPSLLVRARCVVRAAALDARACAAGVTADRIVARSRHRVLPSRGGALARWDSPCWRGWHGWRRWGGRSRGRVPQVVPGRDHRAERRRTTDWPARWPPPRSRSARGALVRTHDVAETVDAVRVAERIRRRGNPVSERARRLPAGATRSTSSSSRS